MILIDDKKIAGTLLDTFTLSEPEIVQVDVFSVEEVAKNKKDNGLSFENYLIDNGYKIIKIK